MVSLKPLYYADDFVTNKIQSPITIINKDFIIRFA